MMIIDLYYKALDFVRSRAGKIFLLCCALLWGIFAFAGKEEASKAKKAAKENRLPRIPAADLWDEAEEDAVRSSGRDQFTASKTNPGFRPLLLPDEKLAPVEPIKEVDQKPVVLIPDLPATEWVPPPRLILLQNSVFTEKVANLEQQVSSEQNQSVKGETVVIPGEVIHCQLISSASSEDPGEPMLARTTRQLIRKGRVVVERGALLSGRIKKVTRQGRFQFHPEWTLLNSGQESPSFHATVHQKDRRIGSGETQSGDGMLGLPGILDASEENKKSQAGKLLNKVLSASARLGQTRINTILGEQVPYNVRNLVLEGGQGILRDRHSFEDKRSPQSTRMIFAGQEFYLEVHMLP